MRRTGRRKGGKQSYVVLLKNKERREGRKKQREKVINLCKTKVKARPLPSAHMDLEKSASKESPTQFS